MNSALSSARRVMPLIALILVTAALLGPSISLAQDGTPGEFTFDFEIDAQGWIVGFADLPVDHDQSIYELDHGHGPLPDELEGSGIYVQGHNRSDDLFMFLKRQVDGLRPDTAYAVSVSVGLATNVPAGLVGIGGSPSESVFVKAGASTVEPMTVEDRNRYLRMNIDKGNQARGGESMVVLGNVAHPEVVNTGYRIKTLDNADLTLVVSADSNGRVWLIVGTDSGFEGLTSLYYARISYTLTRVGSPGSDGATPSPEPTATSAPERTPTAPPTATSEPTRTPESTQEPGPTATTRPTATAGPTPVLEPTTEPTAMPLPGPESPPRPPAEPEGETQGQSAFPTWLIAVLALAGLGVAGTAAMAVRRMRSTG